MDGALQGDEKSRDAFLRVFGLMQDGMQILHAGRKNAGHPHAWAATKHREDFYAMHFVAILARALLWS